MFQRATLVCALLFLPIGCGHSGTENLYQAEVEFLGEDVVDLMAAVFQTGENAYLGDPVAPEDILEDPEASNGYAVFYELPDAFRDGLGFGAGDVILTVREDGIPTEDPLLFSFDTTRAFHVELVYDLRYRGDTAFGRSSDVAFVVTLAARRTADGWIVEYILEGEGFFGDTYCELETSFRAPGRPRDGVESGFGDALGFIDDPDVVDVYEMNLDFGDGRFRAKGDVGCCAYFDEHFFYFEVF